MKRLSTIALSIGVLLTSCSKDVDDLSFDIEPKIVLASQSSTALLSFTDTLILQLDYQDGDGDLGGIEGDSKLFVQDRRLTKPDAFRLEDLRPREQDSSIKGRLQIVLGPYFVLGNAPSEDLELELWITDRAGHESNHVVSQSITLRRQ